MRQHLRGSCARWHTTTWLPLTRCIVSASHATASTAATHVRTAGAAVPTVSTRYTKENIVECCEGLNKLQCCAILPPNRMQMYRRATECTHDVWQHAIAFTCKPLMHVLTLLTGGPNSHARANHHHQRAATHAQSGVCAYQMVET